MLKHRLIFGTFLIIAALGLFWAEDHFQQDGRIIAIALLGIVPLAMIELAGIFRAKSITVSPALMTLAALATAAAVFLGRSANLVGLMLTLTFIAAMAWHCRHKTTQGALGATAATVFGAVYLGVFSAFYLLITREHTCWVALAVVLITKMGDTGAFFTGHAIGKHKLIPWLSPGKTWEGLAGAVVWCTGFAVGFAYLGRLTNEPGNHFSLAAAAGLGAVLAIVGHAGDLSVSVMKRDAGVKDSGRSMPGFGGMLDVMDSPLLVGPIAYWLLHVM
ncbi:phosphatidate cytidylyltransferase [Planctomycetales bacterium ZRK34]|nr:phosphatidate cytidylyltransferase [Planctomycetales bacterium ZRK34]